MPFPQPDGAETTIKSPFDIFHCFLYNLNSRKDTKNGKYCYRSTMKNILDNLGTETIVQFQKSFSVNLDYIKEIEKNTIILKNNEEFNIGRKFKNNVIQKYKEHFLR